jgi:hypothetical protein
MSANALMAGHGLTGCLYVSVQAAVALGSVYDDPATAAAITALLVLLPLPLSPPAPPPSRSARTATSMWFAPSRTSRQGGRCPTPPAAPPPTAAAVVQGRRQQQQHQAQQLQQLQGPALHRPAAPRLTQQLRCQGLGSHVWSISATPSAAEQQQPRCMARAGGSSHQNSRRRRSSRSSSRQAPHNHMGQGCRAMKPAAQPLVQVPQGTAPPAAAAGRLKGWSCPLASG